MTIMEWYGAPYKLADLALDNIMHHLYGEIIQLSA